MSKDNKLRLSEHMRAPSAKHNTLYNTLWPARDLFEEHKRTLIITLTQITHAYPLRTGDTNTRQFTLGVLVGSAHQQI